jgi:uncharacterized membrane protein
MTTLPVAVILKRFLAPLFVFILGIFVFLQNVRWRIPWRLGMPVFISRGRRGARVRAYTEAAGKRQGAPAG